MNKRRAFNRNRTCVSTVVLVLVVGAIASSAQLDVELAGVSGVFQYTILAGDVYIPAVLGEQDAQLIVQGVQALGYREWWCPPYSPTRPASELHLSLSFIAWPDTTEWLSGSLYLPEVTGDFEGSMDLHALLDPDGPITWPEGGNFFELRVGRAHEDINLCYNDLVVPSVQIYSAHLVSSPAVASEQSSWGAVKCLFR